ncbi:MAG TPA: GNAT family N-acetyltransferase [Aestuariivirga sp.]|nr:GNAT family N-acetyltransferase [Aestuariivirga sp.]
MVNASAALETGKHIDPASLTIGIHDSLASLAEDWQDFERTAVATLYQTYLWCEAWQQTCGTARGTAPRIAVIRGASGEILAILPLQIRTALGFRVLEWLGSPHSGYGYGLFSPQAVAEADHWVPWTFPRILDRIGGFDAAALTDMPAVMFDADHPLASCFTLRSANLSFQMMLDSDFETLHARKRDGEDRRAARKKEERLGLSGEVAFDLPCSRDEVHTVLDVMFDHQKDRMGELGVRGVSTPAERDFLHRIADRQDAADPVLLPYRLRCGDETLAVMLGGRHANVFWALISSLAGGPTRKFSPGDLALRKTIKSCCGMGLERLDFSVGDSSYKRAWADTEIHLYHHLSARNFRGLIYVCATGIRMTVKRWVKTTPALLTLSLAVRRTLFGKRTVSR